MVHFTPRLQEDWFLQETRISLSLLQLASPPCPFPKLTNAVQRQNKEGNVNHSALSLAGKEEVKTLSLRLGNDLKSQGSVMPPSHLHGCICLQPTLSVRLTYGPQGAQTLRLDARCLED